jgi:uncharacterized protein (TIGR02996 family)
MLEDLLLGIVEDPLVEPRYLVLADWLEEHDDPRRAELLRLHRRLLATCCEPDLHPERAGWHARIVSMLAVGVKPCVPQRKVKLGEGVEMTLNFIPPGSFLMGSPSQVEGWRDDEVLHRVTLTQGFWLGIYPVTQAQWRAVMWNHPRMSNTHYWHKGDDWPVEKVSWDEGVAFCERLGEKFRLPTEAQWEYACRAGTTTPFYFGQTISTEQANYNGNSTYGKGKKGVYRKKTMPVGSFPANAWGLFDLHGTIWEWVTDWYGPYPERGKNDPVGVNSGTARVLRGGSWYNDPRFCRSARRLWCDPVARSGVWGCRVLLCPDDQVP